MRNERKSEVGYSASDVSERKNELTGQDKAEVIAKYQKHEKDTGTPEVQVALLTGRISQLSEHFKTHAKDHHSRRGLLKIVSQRRRLLDYLKRDHFDRYAKLIKDLGLRR